MLELQMAADDVAGIRFVLSPLHETVVSLTRSDAPAVAARLLAPADERLLGLLVSPIEYVPDFVTPIPDGPTVGIETELQGVRDTSPDEVRRDFLATYQGQEIPAALRAALKRPEQLRDRVAEVLEAYWEAAVKPQWPQMNALLQADLTYRAKRLTELGVRGLFADLHPGVTWSAGCLRVDNERPDARRPSLQGQGLPLLPSLMARKLMVTLDASKPPTVVYPSRGAELLAEQPVRGRTALEDLLGRGRAAVLYELADESTTKQIAARLGLTQPTVSHHLGVLHRAGLATRWRDGRCVVYGATPLADELREAARADHG